MPLLSLLACTTSNPWGTNLPPLPAEDQGSIPGDTMVDSFVIGDPKIPADVLVAVDPDADAKAMLEEEMLPSLIAMLDLAVTDSRVGVTSTALGDPTTAGYLAPVGADGGRWFSHEDLGQLAVDWTDFPDEAPYGGTGATYLTVNADLHGFLRPGATLYLVLASLADGTPDAIVTFEAWEAWVFDRDAIVSARAATGTPLAEVVAASGGAAVDPWGDVAAWSAKVGLLSWGIPDSYRLSRMPIPGTVVVQVEEPSGATFEFYEAVGDPPVGDWIYDAIANSVAFLSYAPDNGSVVHVAYAPRGE